MNVPFHNKNQIKCLNGTDVNKKKKSVIRSQTNVYCTKSTICGFEPITIKAHLFETKVAKKCHKIPQALASHTEEYYVSGSSFNATISCGFNICDVTSFLQFGHWYNFCFSTLELLAASSLLIVIFSFAIISVAKCLLNKSRSNVNINSKLYKLPVEANQYNAENEIAKEYTLYNPVVNDVLTTTCETMK